MTNLESFITQDSDLIYTMETTDESLVGPAKLEIIVESIDYPDYIEPITLIIAVEVLPCEVTELLLPEDAPRFSPLYLIFSLPYSTKIDLPLFETEPVCALTNADLSYSIVGNAPDFMEFDEQSRTITASTEDESYVGKTVRVKMQASYEGVTKDINFAFVFIKESTPPPLEPVEEEPVPEPEPEPEPVPTEPAEGWDGWKILLLESMNLGDGFVLPPPNPDPNYVPTPPKAKVDTIS